ncbi:DUF3011 domain-containing protein [Candidatus Contendibacter odensensis]|uniref:DUF3011 domain-containing protein n=1 Tax=Candidatus Contendobacter odensis Run_B_J11 TaxID=1400861 RepID=A0A7U7G7X3_9GAMM|nr:DUF3011 domain-containing protein [Candidatus Contendobacter odensis]CDH43175.1 conserved exported hypothetical protein [Candidatus Contendobacter odensis Run_B_J11]
MKLSQTTLATALLGGVLVAALTGLPVQDAQARSRHVTCESLNNRYQHCRVDTRGGVQLQRQLSSAACRKDQTWGYDRGGIWVDRGCRAEFRVGSNDHRRNQRLTCSAEGSGRQLCRADVRNEVILIRQLSRAPCRFNSSWGYNRRGVWVDHGCRAEFEIR